MGDDVPRLYKFQREVLGLVINRIVVRAIDLNAHLSFSGCEIPRPVYERPPPKVTGELEPGQWASARNGTYCNKSPACRSRCPVSDFTAERFQGKTHQGGTRSRASTPPQNWREVSNPRRQFKFSFSPDDRGSAGVHACPASPQSGQSSEGTWTIWHTHSSGYRSQVDSCS